MCSNERFTWLTHEIWLGRSASVSFSYNAESNREKIKFVLKSGYSSKGVYRPALLAALSGLEVALANSIVTDKGHYSRSRSESVVEFWLQQLPDTNHAKACVNTSPDMPKKSVTTKRRNEDDDPPYSSNTFPEEHVCGGPNFSEATLEGVTSFPLDGEDETPESPRPCDDEADVNAASPLESSTRQENDQSFTTMAAGTSSSARATDNAQHDLEYLGSLSKFGKEDKIINMLLNKLGKIQTARDSMEGLSKYFNTQLDALTQHLNRTFGLGFSTWPQLQQSVLNEIENNTLYGQHQFTLSAVLCELAEKSMSRSKASRKKGKRGK